MSHAMVECEKCHSRDCRIVANDARPNGTIYRRRECAKCHHRWTSSEVRCDSTQAVLVVPRGAAQALQRAMLGLLEVLGEVHSYKPPEEL